jgi:hypothetical protein
MMNILYRKEKLIFDGRSDDVDGAIKEVSFDIYKYQVILKNLKPIAGLSQYYKNIELDDISLSLGFNVTNFDGIKIYNGSKRGLKLYYQAVKENDKDIILIFSFGESQPGRLICQFEEAILL